MMVPLHLESCQNIRSNMSSENLTPSAKKRILHEHRKDCFLKTKLVNRVVLFPEEKMWGLTKKMLVIAGFCYVVTNMF